MRTADAITTSTAWAENRNLRSFGFRELSLHVAATTADAAAAPVNITARVGTIGIGAATATDSSTRALVMQNIVGVLRTPTVKNLSFCARPKERSPALAPGPLLMSVPETQLNLCNRRGQLV